MANTEAGARGASAEAVRIVGRELWVWSVPRLWSLAEHIPVQDVAVAEFRVLDADAWFAGFRGEAPTVRAVAEHARRINAADLRYPVIMSSEGRVFDGVHRIARALLEGRPTVPVQRFAEDPAPDRIEVLEARWHDCACGKRVFTDRDGLTVSRDGSAHVCSPETALAAEILSELQRARTKFPGDNVTTLALVEEVGELAKATFEEPRDRVRKEAVQVATMAMRVVLDGDQSLDGWRESKGLDPLVERTSAPMAEGGA